MSALAKVFVVINLVLALFFLGVAAASFESNKSWKTDSDAKLAKLESIKSQFVQTAKDQKQKIADLKSQRSNLDTQVATKTSRISELDSMIASKQSEIDTAKAELASKERLLQEKESALAARTSAADDLANSNRDLVKAAQEASDKAKNAVRKMTVAMVNLEIVEKQYGDLQKEGVVMKRELEQLGNLMAVLKERNPNLDMSFIPAPKINGLVSAVDAGTKIVVLSVGQDDSVQTGQEFTVYRNGRYVGVVEVSDVTADMAGARIKHIEPGMSVQIGDKASTRIGG